MAARIDVGGKAKKFERTPQGGIVAPAYLTRVGVFTYMQDIGGRIVPFRELRHPDEVFSKASLDSLRGAPVSVGHPAGGVTSETWKQHAIGQVSDTVGTDGRYVAAEVRVQDAEAVSKIVAGDLIEFSCGYDCDVVAAPPGSTYDGVGYDGIQKNIRYNHVGMGGPDWGRAGNEVRLRVDGGQEVGVARVDEVSTYSLSMDIAEALKLIETLNGATDSLKARAVAAEATAATEKARADSAEAVLATVTARADAAEKSVLTQDAIDSKVASRVSLVDSARHILGVTFAVNGVGDRDLRVAAIQKVDAAFDATGRSDEYVEGRFEALIASDRSDAAASLQLRAAADAAPGTAAKSSIDTKLDAYEAVAPAWKTQNVAR